MPSTSARPRDRKFSLEVSFAPYCAPGASTSREATASLAEPETICWAEPRISERLKPNLASTSTVMNAAPAISSTALMICTHVVPFMPPTST
ncbi:Uncharacterised protein [Mycobacteroides abscessus subsp. abscessus]|nr:Uncharacterised protein [Mycobacteroides abscessus subsp. abscessus]